MAVQIKVLFGVMTFNYGFICIAARMLDYTISAKHDGGYKGTQMNVT